MYLLSTVIFSEKLKPKIDNQKIAIAIAFYNIGIYAPFLLLSISANNKLNLTADTAKESHLYSIVRFFQIQTCKTFIWTKAYNFLNVSTTLSNNTLISQACLIHFLSYQQFFSNSFYIHSGLQNFTLTQITHFQPVLNALQSITVIINKTPIHESVNELILSAN